MASHGNGLKLWPKIILFGDSISQYCFSAEGCWGSLLADHLQRKCDVLGRGFSGYNTAWCKIMLPRILDRNVAKETIAMTIFLGANDSNDPINHQHVPLSKYKENLKEMINHAMSMGLRRDKIILISPPAFDAVAWGEECKATGRDLTKNNETTGDYAKSCCEVATEMGTLSVDLYTEMMKAEDFPKYLNDGLHLSKSGSTLLFSLLQPIVDKLTSDLPENIFPYWRDIDVENPEKSLLQ